jgi:hypothetical protein
VKALFYTLIFNVIAEFQLIISTLFTVNTRMRLL